MRILGLPAALAAMAATAGAIEMNVQDPNSVKSAAKTIAQKMLTWYTGNQPGGTPGILPQPYYWWEAGEMLGSLIDYWYYTGDDQYNDLTIQGLVFQYSPTYDFMPPNQTKNEGNDDQMFWGIAVMSAAEYKFPNPPADQPSWISVAQAVFNSQYIRWDTTLCGGGLRWQIFQWNQGYNYKNSPSNAGLINLSARLYAYTENETYSDSVTRSWDWMTSIGLISPTYQVFDGSNGLQNCTSLDHIQWTYSAGMLLNAAAVMWNKTNGTTQQMWQERVQGLWNESAAVFFDKNKIMLEIACEPQNNCNLDQQSFKGPFSRFLAASVKVAPFLYDQIRPYLAASAAAAAAQCSGGSDGITCGTKWTNNGVWDGTTGVGQQQTALEVICANLIANATAPVSHNTGGISQGNASLGTSDNSQNKQPVHFAPITTGDKAGAGILTAIVLVGTLAGGWWLIS